MPNPREAIFDVLQAKKRRRDEEKRVHDGKSQEEALEEWNEKNQTARRAVGRLRG